MRDLRRIISENAVELNRLHQRMSDAERQRSWSDSHRAAWLQTYREFRENYGKLAFPWGDQHSRDFLAGDSAAIDTMITFLEVNPIFFRSGYMKEEVWRRFKRFDLSPAQSERIESAAFNLLRGRKSSREFWYMVRYLRFRGSTDFWRRVDAAAADEKSVFSAKATWLVAARRGRDVPTWIHREVSRERHDKRYFSTFRYPYDLET